MVPYLQWEVLLHQLIEGFGLSNLSQPRPHVCILCLPRQAGHLARSDSTGESTFFLLLAAFAEAVESNERSFSRLSSTWKSN